MKLQQKSSWINKASLDAFENTINNGNRESIRPINDLLDTLHGKPTGKKVSFASLKDFRQQKNITVRVTNFDKARTTAYFELRGKPKIYEEGYGLVKQALQTKMATFLKVKDAMDDDMRKQKMANRR